MKPSAWLFSAAMSVSCLALAQTAPQSQVTENTDPAKIAEIERRAQELAATGRTTSTMDERDQAQKPPMRHEKSKKHKRAKKSKPPMDKAPTDAPMMEPESKG